ncbi:MAG: SRPBCC family protein [Alistipes sp.]|nr:SRPBCC family protein [Alistipes sp.]
MTKFESKVVAIPYGQQRVFDTLSDLSNLEKVRSMLPEDKVRDLKVSTDAVSLSVPPVGDIAFQIVEREAPKCVKFQASTSPIPLTLWVQILPTAEEASKAKLTLHAELNPFIKGMVQKPIQDALEKLADLLAGIAY